MKTRHNRISGFRKMAADTFHTDNNLKIMFRKFGILAVLTLVVMGVPGAVAQVVYNPVTQFYTQASPGGRRGTTLS
jgi:hypothetical protein